MDSLYLIGGPRTQALEPAIVGNKAANLSRMAAMGLPVPPAFVVPTSLCAGINKDEPAARAALDRALDDGVRFLEEQTGRRFGDRRRPLLVSVRSGAPASMPGMLDTVLDVGCTSEAVHGLIRTSGNPRFAWDCRRRFLEGYCETVLGLDPRPLESTLAAVIAEEGAAGDAALDGEALERFAAECLGHAAKSGADVPDDAHAQLRAAACAVYRSWESDKARAYRRLTGVAETDGTAVTVQAMVFGNRGRECGAGVAFSRDPSTGAKTPVIDVMFEAQGEDVVSGRRTPDTGETLAARLPTVSTELLAALATLESAFRDVQDVEFTIENRRLWLLQTRAAKRTPRAALRIAVDDVRAGLITPAEAVARLRDIEGARLVVTRFGTAAEPIGAGVPAAPGVAAGRTAFDSATAQELAAKGDPVILARPDTSTADVAGFAAAAGIVTTTGGRTAHAALVARQMGKPCVVACQALAIDEAARRARVGGVSIAEGDWLSIDGDAGAVFAGRLPIVDTRPEEDLAAWMQWKEQAADAAI
ncbi:MAG TPA: PEP/pyruvate-binding domain-containing protein [Methylomirabilota bacterium]|nr:PEP/pyruvate-binding domain-containing protein [Methylomirabilota bacterium]